MVKNRVIKYYQGLKNQKGAALLLVLWIIVLLGTISSQFLFSSRVETSIVKNFKDEQEAYYVAVSAVELAKAEILSSKEQIFINDEGILILNDEKPVRNGEINGIKYSFSIVDEESKLNINLVRPEELRYIIESSGVEKTAADEIIDSILDWRDEDNLHRLNGAEDEYYKTLEQPYNCKNGDFDLVEELQMVKGVKKEYLFGSKGKDDKISLKTNDEYKGFSQYLTTKGSGRININTALKPVLYAVFGAAMADNIILGRSAGPIIFSGNQGVVNSTSFTIIATSINDKIKRSIKTIVTKKEINKLQTVKEAKKLQTVYWNDNWKEYEINEE